MGKEVIKKTVSLNVEANVSKLTNLKDSMSVLTDDSGVIGKNANKIVESIDELIIKLKQSGKSMPLNEVNKILASIQGIETLSSRIIEAANKPVKSVKEINAEIKKAETELKKANDALNDVSTRREELKSRMSETRAEAAEKKADELLKLQKFQYKKGNKHEYIIEPGSGSTIEKIKEYINQDTSKITNQNELNYINSRIEKLKQVLEISSQVFDKEQEEMKALNKEYKENLSLVAQKQAAVDKAKNQSSTPINPNAAAVGAAGQTVARDISNDLEVLTQKALEAGQSQIELSKTAETNNVSFKSLGKTLINTRIGYQLFKKILRESIHTIEEMDKAITGMTVVTGMSREEAESYISTIQDISKATSTAMTDVANLTTEYLRQGRVMKDALTLAEETAKAAKISGLSTSDTIQYMTAAVNGFNLAAEDAAHVSDVFSNLAASSATNYENLAIALSKVSAQANLAGMSLEYTSALLAKGMETTQEAPESIGTALKTVIARMRELDDYGSTLEDGANVNSVESALKSAGITLRDVNGEFRNLEDIFNELGPQWDSLNSMQQQAIAQAVAGTRQQSRFVAIMQDWERTSELIAESQDSVGASAAQYAQYAKGMEAAVTNLQNSWQGFIQSITDSKIIIGSINIVSKFIDSMPGRIALIGTAIFGVLPMLIDGVNKIKLTFNTITESLKIISGKDKEEALTIQQQNEALIKQLTLRKQVAKMEYDELAKKSGITDKPQDILNMNKEDRDKASITDKDIENAREMVYLEQQMNTIDGQILELKEKQENADANIVITEQEKTNIMTQLSNQELTELQTQLDLNNAELAKNDALKENLLTQQAILDTMLTQASVEAKLHAGMDTSNMKEEELLKWKEEQLALDQRRDGLQAQSAAMSDRIAEIQNKNIDLNKKNNQLLLNAAKNIKGQSGLMTLLTNKISRKLGVNLTGIGKTLKGSVKWTKDLVSGNLLYAKTTKGQNVVLGDALTKEKQRNGELAKRLTGLTDEEKNSEAGLKLVQAKEKSDQSLTDLKELQNKKDATALLTQGEVASLSASEAASEEAIAATKGTELAVDSADLGVEEGQTVALKKEEKLEWKNLIPKISGAIATIAQSASQPYGVGLPFAIAGAALLALIGTAVAVNATENQSGKTEDQIASQQTAMYNLKKSYSTNTGYADEYEELLNKSVRTEEEEERFQELTESIQDLSEDFEGMEGEQLLNELKLKNLQDSASLKKLSNDSYYLALSMENLGESEVGKNAITNKLLESQDKLIESNVKLAEVNNELVKSNVETNSAKIIQNSVDNLDDLIEEQGLSYSVDDYNFWDYAVNIGVASLLYGATGTIISLGAAIAEDIYNKQQRKQAQEDLDSYLQLLNERIVNFTVDLETTIAANEDLISEENNNNSVFADNVKAYSELITTFTEEEREAIDQTYSSFSFITKMITDEQGSVNEETLNTIDKLLELQILTEEAIEKLAELMNGIDETAAKVTESAKIVSSDSFTKVYQRLLNDSDNNISSGMTITELYDEIMSHAKYNNDGSLKYNENGTIKFRDDGWKNGMTDATIRSFVDQLTTVIANGQEDLTIDAVKALGNAYSGVSNYNFKDNFNSFLSNLEDTYNETIGSGKNFDEAAQVEAYYNAANNSEFYQKIKALEEAAINIRTSAEQFKNTDQNTYASLINQASELESEADTWRSKIDSAIQDIAGYMDSTTMADLYTSTTSSIESAADIWSKLQEGSELSSEEVDTLGNVVDKIIGENKDLDYDSVWKELANGTALGAEYMQMYNKAIKEDTQHKLELAYANAAYWENLTSDEDEKQLYTKIKMISSQYLKMVDEYEKGTSKLTADEFAYESIKAELEILETGKDAETISSMQQQQAKIVSLLAKSEILIDNAYGDMVDKLWNTEGKSNDEVKALKDRLKSWLKYEEGILYITEEGQKEMTAEQYEYIEENKESLEELLSENKEFSDKQLDLTESLTEAQIDSENELYDAYCTRLEEENEALKEALDSRKELYEKYYDSLEEEDDEEDYEEKRLRLQNAISRLAASTDASSLQKLKDYQQELQDLEDEHNQTIRDNEREALLAQIDNEQSLAEQKQEEAEENKQTIIDALKTWTDDQLAGLLIGAQGTISEAERAKYLEDAKTSIADFRSATANTTSNANGGIVDYTGYAWVDGTPSKPEAFLNADQTSLFTSLANSLSQAVQGNASYNSNNDTISTVSIDALNISVSGNVDSGNMEQTGNDIANAFLEGLRRTGINLNKKA